MFKLYYAPGTCALASHIALAEAGAPYTTAKVDFKTNQQNSPEYLAINPKGRVPSLVIDHGILTETPAMLAFIAQSFPQAKLAPLDNAFAFAQAQGGAAGGAQGLGRTAGLSWRQAARRLSRSNSRPVSSISLRSQIEPGSIWARVG